MVGDMLSAFGTPAGVQIPATSSAGKPRNSSGKSKGQESEDLKEAKSALWLSSTLIIGSIVVLGFGSKLLNNVRIA